jgi:hypothetical protein
VPQPACAGAAPGATQKVERSTTDRSSGVSLRSIITSPVVPEGSAGDARFRPSARLPEPVAVRHRSSVARCPQPPFRPSANRLPSRSRVHGGRLPDLVTPWPCRRFPGRCAAPTPVPGEPDPVAGVGARSAGKPAPSPLGAVHADPVARALDAGAAEPRPREQLGCSFGLGPVTLRPWPPVARRLGAQSEVVSRSVRTRSRLVDRVRFPPPTTRRCSMKDSVSRPRSACAARYEGHFRERETPGQAVFLNPQGYPPNFSSIPSFSSVVHLLCTHRAQVCPQNGPFARGPCLTFGVPAG